MAKKWVMGRTKSSPYSSAFPPSLRRGRLSEFWGEERMDYRVNSTPGRLRNAPRGWDPSQGAQLQRVLSLHSNAGAVAAPVKIDARHGEPWHLAPFADCRGRIASAKLWAASRRGKRGGFECREFRQPRNHSAWHVRATPPPSHMDRCGMGDREGNGEGAEGQDGHS